MSSNNHKKGLKSVKAYLTEKKDDVEAILELVYKLQYGRRKTMIKKENGKIQAQALKKARN